MVVGNVFFANATKMSLSDRFTILQSVRPVRPVRPIQAALMDLPGKWSGSPGFTTRPVRPIRSGPVGMRGMRSDREIHSRRLIERLALKPIMEAASVLQKRPLKQRIGYVQRRPPFNTSPRNAKKTNNKSQNNIAYGYNAQRIRPTKQRRSFQGKYQNRAENGQNQVRSPTSPTSPSFIRGRGARRRGVFRGQVNNDAPAPAPTYPNTRGRGRNQRRGIDRSWYAQKTPPTKEELDKQLDQYMAGTRSQLDKELDTYMSNAMDVDNSFL